MVLNSGSGGVEHVYQFTPAQNIELAVNLLGSVYDTTTFVASDCVDDADFCQFNDDFVL